MKKCPYCAEEIQDDAVKCRYCGEMLNQKRSYNCKVTDGKETWEELEEGFDEKEVRQRFQKRGYDVLSVEILKPSQTRKIIMAQQEPKTTKQGMGAGGLFLLIVGAIITAVVILALGL